MKIRGRVVERRRAPHGVPSWNQVLEFLKATYGLRWVEAAL